MPPRKRPAPSRAARRRAPQTRSKVRPARSTATTSPASAARRDDASSGLAPGMQTVNTYLAVANVNASMEFLERAFAFTRGVVLPDTDGQIRYAEMRHGESVIMLIRKGDAATATGGSPALYAYVTDVDATAAQARQAGGGVGDAQDMPWGDRTAGVPDPDGYRWVLATFKKLAPFT